MASWRWRLDPCKHCGSRNVELMYLGSKNRLDGGPDTPPITKCRDCGKYSDDPIGVNKGDKNMIFLNGLNQNKDYFATWMEIQELKRKNKALEKEFIQRQINELNKNVDNVRDFVFQCCEMIQPGYKECHSQSFEEAQNFIKRHLSKGKDFIHKAKCCVNCIYHSDATCYSGQCAKFDKKIVNNNQVCDYFIERGKENDRH